MPGSKSASKRPRSVFSADRHSFGSSTLRRIQEREQRRQDADEERRRATPTAA
jgi:hypothetical protein